MSSTKNGMRPIHPGEVLREEFLLPLDMSANHLAQVINVPANRITEIVAERRNIRPTRRCAWRARSERPRSFG